MSEKNFNLDDFIGEEIETSAAVSKAESYPSITSPSIISPGKKINPKEKLTNFSDIKVSAIDPRIRSELEVRLKAIEQNLNKLKHLKA